MDKTVADISMSFELSVGPVLPGNPRTRIQEARGFGGNPLLDALSSRIFSLICAGGTPDHSAMVWCGGGFPGKASEGGARSERAA